MLRENHLHATVLRPRRRWFLTALMLGSWVAPLAAAEPRTWTSTDGKTVVAELIDATDTTVTIKNEGGRDYTVPHERFSEADREVILAFLAKKKADYDQMVWPRASAEEVIKAPHFRRLHLVDAKRHTGLYAGRVLSLEGEVLDVKEDRMSSTQGVIVVLDTEDRVPVEVLFLKANYEKDLTLLLGDAYNRYRGPYGEDAFRVVVADKSLSVERRYVVSRDYDYNYTVGSYRYRKKWSDWEVVAKPVSRGETVRMRGEFVSVFNSVMSFKDGRMAEQTPARKPQVNYAPSLP
ncbi:MAG: hypothetical protein MUE42_07590 [Opitutaceae bacterium]|jgi:hypothetical protein|nr:hypothetical protein [Opitutaceae bacterium]